MRVLLVGAGLEENLSLAYLASALRVAGHPADLEPHDGPGDTPAVVRRAREGDYGLVGVSVAFQHRLREFRDLARALREAGVAAPLVWGGHVPTARADGVLREVPEVDVVVRHDGERTLADLAAALESAGPLPCPAPALPRPLPPALLARLAAIPGLAFRLADGRPGATPPRPVEADLDALEPPARDRPAARHAGLGFAPIVGSRGCWQSCTYCSIHTYHRGRGGPRVRFRDPDAVAAEMSDLYHRRQVRIFCFHDENLFLPTPGGTVARLGALREGLRRRAVGRIGVVAKCRPDQVTPRVLDEARRLGVMRVYIGIENGSQPGLDHLGRDTDVATCARSLSLLRDAGIYACFNVLLFEPDTTLRDVADNLAFLRAVPDVPWNFCRAEVYPGAVLEDRLRGRGTLRGGLEGMTYALADPFAELLFRVCAVAFGGRNFGPQSTANLASGLGYLAALLRHFHPGRATDRFVQEATAQVRRLSDDTLDRLQEALAFVRTPGAAAAAPAFAADLAARVAASDAVLAADMESLRDALEAWGRARADAVLAPRGARPLARAAAVLAATSLAGTACFDPGGPNVLDPVPTDLGDDTRPDAWDVPPVDPLPPDAWDVPPVDPPPPDAWDVPPVDPPPPDAWQDLPPVDPPPPDAWDVPPVDPPPPDAWQDLPPVDPPPPDAWDVPPVDPPPPDAWQDLPPVDPPPPDILQDAPDDGAAPPRDLPPVDPPPPDFGPPPDPQARALPLDRSFRVRLSACAAPDGSVSLEATTGAGPRATFAWSALGGRLEVRGAEARFTPDGSRPPLVVVTARAPGGRLDVARHLPGARRS